MTDSIIPLIQNFSTKTSFSLYSGFYAIEDARIFPPRPKIYNIMTTIINNSNHNNNNNSSVQLDINPKYLLWASITKTNIKQNAGLHLKQSEDGTILIDRVDGAFQMFTEVKPGNRLLKIQEQNVEALGLKKIQKLIKESMRVEVEVFQPRDDDDNDDDNDDDDATSVMTVEIVAGDSMTLQNLTATPDLNGKVVKIKRESSKEGRWLVQVTSSGEMMIVDAKNLRAQLNDEEEDY